MANYRQLGPNTTCQQRTQPPDEWVPEYVVSILRMHGAMPPLFHVFSGTDAALSTETTLNLRTLLICGMEPGQFSRYSDSLRAERTGGRMPVEARFSALFQTGSEAHPASCTMGTGSFPGVKRLGRGVDQPSYLAPRLRKSRAIPLLPPLGLRGLF